MASSDDCTTIAGENPDVLRRARQDPIELLRELPPGIALSRFAVERDAGPLVRIAERFSSGSPLHRTWAHLLVPPAPPLVDPHGRTVTTRTRVLSAAVLLATDALSTGPDPDQAFAFATVVLELAATGPVRERVVEAHRRGGAEPSVVALVSPTLEALPPRSVDRAHAAPPAVVDHVRAVLRDLAPHVPAGSLVVRIATDRSEEEDDDPLGLMSVLAELTGGRAGSSGGRAAALESADRLAMACDRTAIDAACLILAVADVLAEQAPPAALAALARTVDRELGAVRTLLAGVRGGAGPGKEPDEALRSAAGGLDRASAGVVEGLAHLVPASTGLRPDVRPPFSPPVDALAEAWAEGRASEPLALLAAEGAGLEGRVARSLARAATGPADPAELAELADATARRPALSLALRVLATCSERSPAARPVRARELSAAALARGDDLALAVASQIELDAASDRADAQVAAVRRIAGLGDGAGCSLLLRYTPPDPDEGSPT